MILTVFVEYLMLYAITGEVLFYRINESTSYLDFYSIIEWWVNIRLFFFLFFWGLVQSFKGFSHQR